MSEDGAFCFTLRADGYVHSSDIRHVSSASGLILTASRDNSAMIFSDPPLGDDITPGLPLVGHTAFVNFALFHPSMALLDGNACVVTGSNDKHVALWDPQTTALEAVMDGHAHGVCCGAVLLQHGGHIVTGDWGGVCVVFDGATGCLRQHYSGHKTAVRGVAHLPGTSTVVSVSGDKTAHQWDFMTGETIAVFVGHKDVVQCVCAMSATRFATGGNDALIIVWDTTTGTAPLSVLAAHDSLLYGLSYCAARRLLFSASEDRTLRVWQGGVVDFTLPSHLTGAAVVQCINHPCVVWSVCVTGVDGDVATAGSDGVLRLWAMGKKNMASAAKLEAFKKRVATQTIDVKILNDSGLDATSIPRADELHLRQGTVEGERLLARTEAGVIEVYAWNCGSWEKVGTVVEGPEGRASTGVPQPREKVYVNGVPHDYVFEVDVNGIGLKLTYDKNQRVSDAAQKFINENYKIVSQSHKEEIENFILKNVDAKDLPQGAAKPFSATGETKSTSNVAAGGGRDAFSAEPVFSQFAQEAAALRQAGHSHIPSWGEALRGLENSGASANNAVFSTYAQEGALLQQQTRAVAAGGGASGGGGGGANKGIVGWDSFKLFTTFNAAGAQRKIDEFAGEARFAGLVQRAIAAAGSDCGGNGDGETSKSIIDDAMALYAWLPESSRFPVVDMFAHVLAVAVDPFGWLQLLLLGNGRGGCDEGDLSAQALFIRERAQNLQKVSEVETLVTIRLFAHIIAALDKSPPEVVLSSSHFSLLSMMIATPQSFLHSKNNNIKNAISALMRNAAVLLVKDPPLLGENGVRDLTRDVVRIVAKWLIFEPILSPITQELLATIMTFMFFGGDVRHGSAAAVARVVGRGALCYTLQALKDGPEPTCREAATKLLNVFNSE